MSIVTDLYRPSLALLTDLYQLTMAYGYWQRGRADDEAVFHLFFRRNPFAGGYAICAGLEYVIDFLQSCAVDEEDKTNQPTRTGAHRQTRFVEPVFADLRKQD
ncbi:MAG: hypothetical protein QGI68_13440, partial [Pseudomonadales bacterium]|nr:hypothetical protein [Pseudomonadales bacterium]